MLFMALTRAPSFTELVSAIVVQSSMEGASASANRVASSFLINSTVALLTVEQSGFTSASAPNALGKTATAQNSSQIVDFPNRREPQREKAEVFMARLFSVRRN